MEYETNRGYGNFSNGRASRGGGNFNQSHGDDADDEKCKLFIGGLNWETQEDELASYFGQFGAVKSVSIKKDRMTGQPRGFGFIVYNDEESVTRTLGTRTHNIGGRMIEPKRAKSNINPGGGESGGRGGSSNKIFVGGVDPDLPEEEINDYFSHFGHIASIDLPFDAERGTRKTFLFVTFSSEEDAQKATQHEKQEINGNRRSAG